ncbi:MAG TPA: transcription elongation factor GreA [Acholeplasma sp.]|nr:transcription elongation factor GreA [Acholeplasma sp.]
MSTKRVFELTQDGVDRLKDELIDLEENKRPQNLQQLKEAREQGDLSENADYDAARTEQSKIEARINEINNILKYAKIIRNSDKDTIEIGKVVTIKYLDNNKTKKFRLVGTLEANPMLNKISVDSPIGKALIGLELGSQTTYKTQTNKTFQIEVVEISNENI